MDLGSRHKLDPSFNMSSMTDIVFLLLIFFMLTSNFVTQSAHPVNLPKGNKTVVEMQKVSISVTAEGEFYVEKEKVALSQLKSEVMKRLSGDSDDRKADVIIVNGDVGVDYGEVMKAVQVCGETGAKVSLATTTK